MNTLFAAIDLQEDFLSPDGKLYIPGSETIRPNLLRLTKLARERNIKVINTGDWHTISDPEISEKPDYKTTFPMHCKMGSTGAEFIEETDPKNDSYGYFTINLNQKIDLNMQKLGNQRNIVIYKNKFDVFEGNALTKDVIKNLGPKTVIVYGVAMEICVNFAIQGLIKMGLSVGVVKDAIWGLPGSDLDNHLKNWWNENVNILTTEMVCNTIY